MSGSEGSKKRSPDRSVIPEDDTDDVCCMCHDGGDLISCDGPCRRSFHPTVDSAEEAADCRSLEMTQQELRKYTSNEDLKFFCKNCKHGQQQCFECKELGSSTGLHEGMKQVFLCVSCARFYHAHCVGLQEPGPFLNFECPSHRCHAVDCVGGEKLIPCRLCPKAWHEGCLTKEISFEDRSDRPQRGWKLLHPETNVETAAFVFCNDHELNRRGMPGYNSSLSILFPEGSLDSPKRPPLPDSQEQRPRHSRELRSTPRLDKQPAVRAVKQVASRQVEPSTAFAKPPERQEVPKRIPVPIKSIKEDFRVKPKRPAIFLDPGGRK